MTGPTQARHSVPIRAFLYVTAAYLAALGVGWVVATAMPASHPLVALLLADVAATLVVFAFSVAFDNSSLYDPYWSVAPLAIVPFLVSRSTEGWTVRAALVAALVAFWGLRLTWNWARGWEGIKDEDWRYASFRGKAGRLYWPLSFLGFHLMPTCMVFLGLFGLHPALVAPAQGLGPLDLLAAAVTLGAALIEAIADLQLRRFCQTKGPGEIMARGLWRYSRHPNYFGEVAFWWGIWLFGVAADPSSAAWTFAGPAAMTFLFVVVSVPMLDRRSLERRPEYALHMKRVSALVPWFPKGG